MHPIPLHEIEIRLVKECGIFSIGSKFNQHREQKSIASHSRSVGITRSRYCKVDFSEEKPGLSEMILVFLRRTGLFSDKFGFSPDKIGLSLGSKQALEKPGFSD